MSAGKTSTDKLKSRVVNLYNSGMPITKIGEKLNLPPTTIRRRLEKWQISIRPSSFYRKGSESWNKGVPHTEKHKKALRRAWVLRKKNGLGVAWNKGRSLSASHKRALSESLKGREIPEKTRKKISSSLKKVYANNPDLRQQLSDAKKGKLPKNFYDAVAKANKVNRENPRPKSYYRKIGLKGVEKQQKMGEPTSIEKKVYSELTRREIFFEKQKLIGGKFLVDTYIPGLNLIIECDGDYWHSLERVKKKDRAENAYLEKCGYDLLRLTETEINNGDYIEKMEEIN